MRFLKLPPELIITVLKTQLKFFPLLSSDGKIQPYFIAVRDGSSENQQEVAHGFESVVEARLSDAVFFFEKDLARKLSDMAFSDMVWYFPDGTVASDLSDRPHFKKGQHRKDSSSSSASTTTVTDSDASSDADTSAK